MSRNSAGHPDPAGRRFFYYGNEAQTIHSIPMSFLYNKPFDFNMDLASLSSLTRPAFPRRTVSTVMTVTSTVPTVQSIYCIPSTQFATSLGPINCVLNQRRLDDDALKEISPSPVSRQ